MRTPGGVLVVGSINVDLVVRVARLPAVGETVSGGSFARHHGGKGANQAVAVARLGATVTFVGAVGDDEDGRSAVTSLADEGIDVGGVASLAGTHTGIALIVVDERGENQIAVAPGANSMLDGRTVEDRLTAIGPAAAVLLANFEVGDAALLASARFARRHGLRLVLNPAPARPLLAELVEMEPILVANTTEAIQLSGEHDIVRAAAVLAGRTGAAVVVTRGPAGALLHAAGEVVEIPAVDVTVVDSTGAGDTFAGAFAAELARGEPVEQATRFAVAAAGLSVSRPGARGGMPRRDQVEALLG